VIRYEGAFMPIGNAKLLIVEDDPDVRNSLERRFRFEGFQVTTAESGEFALDILSTLEPDIVLLDVMLPGLDGFAVAERVRSVSNVPILMLTAKDSVQDRVSGLECGADDYLVKPFELPELMARVRALLRRSRILVTDTGGGTEVDALVYAGIALNRKTRDVSVDGESMELTPREFSLLEYFLQHPKQVMTRDQILEGVWGYDSEGSSNLVDVYVLQLRKKLEAKGGASDRRLHTVRGVGYSLRDPSGV
jgi:two-component system, OmpR family, response regulator MprA